jgi:hypothetical protein
MFVIVHNNSVILGPMRWNRYRFQNTITEECEVTATLPDRNDGMSPIIVSNDVKILPIQGTENPQFNPKIEFLNGPFWEFTDSAAIMSYRVEEMNIDSVKSMLKQQSADVRWKKEMSGVEVTINGTTHKFATDRETRNILQSHISAGLETVNWKFNADTWVQLSQTHLQQVLSATLAHVQLAFDWEMQKNTEIDSCATLNELDAVVISEE